MRRWIVIALAAVFLAGCSNTLPAADWCFRFDFRNSNYGFNVQYGEWIPGVGFSTDAQGRFLVQYTHSSTVTSNGLIITAARGSGAVTPTKVILKADIFGVHVDTLQTLVPAEANTSDFMIEGSGSSDKLQVTGEAVAPMRWLSLQVRGTGSNPFGSSNCDTTAINLEESPVAIPIPGEVEDALIEIDDSLASVDVPLTAPDGQPLLPSLSAAPQVFGYIKWIVSGAAANELAGPFAPIVSGMGIFLVMNFALTAIYFIVYGAVYIGRWILWLVHIIMQLLQTIGALIGSVQGLIIIGAVVAIVIVAAVIAANIEAIGVWIQDIIQKINDFLPG